MNDIIKNKPEHRERNKIVAGIIIVGVGIALLLRNMGFLLPPWLFTWPMILILVGIYSGIKHNFRNNSWIILTGIGVFFLIDKFIPTLHLEPYFWPLVIIGIGLLYIIVPRKRSWVRWRDFGNDDNYNRKGRYSRQESSGEGITDSNDEFTIRSILSGVKKNIISKNFKRGYVKSVFGGAEIDMSRADITGPAYLQLEVVFGGVSIVVPSNWSVQNEIEGVFHGVDDKRYNASASIDPDKVLVLKGKCVFGGIEINSY
jgi:predicted membrane protein